MVQCDGCKIDRPAQQIQVIDSGERLCAACMSELRGGVPPAPATQPAPQVVVKEVVTTQRTSKPLKAQILIASLIVIIGSLLLWTRSAAIGLLMVVVGLLWFIIARIVIWWCHA